MGLKFTVTIPVLTELDVDPERIEAAMRDAARDRMRRKGLEKGQNLVGASGAAARAAEDETREQLRRSRVGGVHHRSRRA